MKSFLNIDNLLSYDKYNCLSEFLTITTKELDAYLCFESKDGQVVKYSYPEFIQLANKMSNLLHFKEVKPRTYAILQLRSKELFVITFWACILSGIIPAILEVPDEWQENNSKLDKLKAVDGILSKSSIIICDNDTILHLKDIFQDRNCISISRASEFSSEFTPYVDINKRDIALLAFTSGSTGIPKAVQLSHQNLIAVTLGIIQANTFTKDDVFLSWMPNDHVGTVVFLNLVPSLLGCTQIHVDNLSVFANPNLCFEYLYKYKASVTWMLNFMFELFYNQVESLSPNIDLSHIRFIMNGGEKINLDVLNKAILKLQLYSMRDGVVHPAWGMTETSSGVIYNSYKVSQNSSEFGISLGFPIPGVSIRIVDENHKVLEYGQPGYLEVSGLTITPGYLNNEEANKSSFYESWFMTGDIAVITQNGVYFIGRDKDDININGRNIALGEIEQVLNTVPGVVAPYSIAICSKAWTPGAECLIICVVLAKNKKLADLFMSLQQTLIENFGTTAEVAYQLKESDIPRNAIGKILKKPLQKQIEGENFKYVDVITKEFAVNSPYLAPRNSLEQQLCTIWSEVLDIPKTNLSIGSEFFTLGGNSILAIKLVHAINKQLNKNIQIQTLYRAKNIANLSIDLGSDKFIYADYQITLSNDKHNNFGNFSTSNVQQAYLIGREEKNTLGGVSTHVYYESMYEYVDKARLEQAINKLMERHILLKSVFNSDLTQRIISDEFVYKVVEYKCKTDKELLIIRNKMSHEVVALDIAPLFNVALSQLSYLNKSVVHFSFDGVLLDFESIKIFLQELEEYYNNKELSLVPLDLTFKDYREQIDKIRQSGLYEEHRNYWLNKLEDFDFTVSLPIKFNPSLVHKPIKFARISKTIHRDIWHKISLQARKYDTSLTSLVLAVYGKTLAFWSGKQKVTINLTLYDRLPLHDQVYKIMGDFTVLQLFNYSNYDGPIHNGLDNIHSELWDNINHSLFDGVDFIRLIRQNRNISLDQIIAPIVLTSALGESIKWSPKFDQQKGEVLYATAQTPQLLIDNKAYEIDGDFIAEWDYVEQLFDRTTIEAMHNHYCQLIEYLADANWESERFPSLQLPSQDLAIINKANSAKQKSVTTTLFGYYEDYIVKHNLENNIAVIDNCRKVDASKKAGLGSRYTYAKLLNESKLLAQYIVNEVTKHNLDIKNPIKNITKISKSNSTNTKQQSHTGKLIAILSEKGYNQVIGTTAIMKAGYGYLPLNIDWPIGRIDEILTQGQITLVLISKHQFLRVEIQEQLSSKYELVVIEDVLEKIDKNTKLNQTLSKINLPKILPDDIAYVIYTSGSTGVPKGVTTSHKGALNTIVAVNSKYKVKAEDKILALSELSFDLSVYDICGLLGVGGAIVFPNQSRTKEPSYWVNLVEEHKITLWNSVPQLAELFIDEAVLRSELSASSLRLFLLSGDWIPATLPDKVKKSCPKAKVTSLGGATEGGIWSIWYEIDKIKDSWNKIPYGIAMPNQKMYVLNPHMEPSPVGVLGEIYIGGDGVALGYYQDVDRTNGSFINHPELGRIYKTGDQGKWSSVGYMEFAGRIDNQVKLNGYRVELDEIASRLNKLPGIESTLINIQNSQLVAYLISANFNKEAHDESIQTFKLAQKGLINNLVTKYQLSLELNEEDYRLRKSYRSFEHIIDIQNLLPKIANLKSSKLVNPATLTVIELTKLLLPVSGLKLADKVLPKYLYPSAGSSYAIRTLINIPEGFIPGVDGATYYYHPIDYKLQYYGANSSSQFSFQFRLFLPAIQPLYQGETKRLAYLELGHIFSLVEESAKALGYGLSYEVIDQQEEDEWLLAELSLSSDSLFMVNPVTAEVITNENNNYVHNDVVLRLNEEPINFQASELGQILSSASAIYAIKGDNDPSSYIHAGYHVQRLCSQLYRNNVGSCTIGYNLDSKHIYTVAIGGIDGKQKQLSESSVKIGSLGEWINKLLGVYLPEYMLPQTYIELTNLPLTSNGKIDYKQLPKAPSVEAHKYVAPRNELEMQLSLIWSEVLGVTQVGIADDFFMLGGNSLLAIKLVGLINLKLQIQLNVKDIFSNKNILSIVNIIQQTNITKQSSPYKKYMIAKPVNEYEPFNLTNIQHAYLYGRLGNFEIGNISTHNYSELLFSDFNLGKFEKALNILINRHGALRMIFAQNQQIIFETVNNYQLLNNGTIDKNALQAIRNRLSHKVYDAGQWPLFDFELSYHEDKYILHVSFDVLIMDGSSFGIFIKELTALYNSEDMESVQLTKLPISFRDYIIALEQVRSSEIFEKAKQYWLNKLDQYDFSVMLPMAVKPNEIKTPHFARLTKVIDSVIWAKLVGKANRYNISPTSIILYIYGAVLTKWSGSSKFCINLTIFNRLPVHESVNNILGDFTVLELFNFIQEKQNQSIADAIQHNHHILWSDIEHNLFDGIDFQRLIRKELHISEKHSLSPIVLTSILGNKDFDITLNGYIKIAYSITQTSQVYLDNKAYETSEGFVAEWDYVEQLFDPETIRQMHETYCMLIESLAEVDWDKSLPEIKLPIFDQEIITKANSQLQNNVTQTLTELFSESVAKYPSQIAVIDSFASYSYAQIAQYANTISNYLRVHQLYKPGQLIAVLSEKGYQQVVATLGIMQSSLAYLPLHIDWPLGRCDEVLGEGMIQIVLVTNSKYKNCIKGSDLESKYAWLIIEELINFKVEELENTNSTQRNIELNKPKLDDIAYVIFTSGSTGKPKGVMISHKGAVNTILAVNAKFKITNHDRVLALSELSFDLSVYDIFGMLTAGGTIVFPEQNRTKDLSYCAELIDLHQITLWNTVPQLAELLIDSASLNKVRSISGLRLFLLSGDWIPINLPDKLREVCDGAKVISLGGATEGSIWSIWYEIDKINSDWKSIPYGIAMPNQKIYILNEKGEPSPLGVIGEIYIGGDGVALGYWNDIGKTDASFIEHSCLGRVYKTGDLGKWNSLGYVEFVGRKDNQVKINGYRVELEEISAKLSRLPGINEAIIQIQQYKNNDYIVGYLLPDNKSHLQFQLLKDKESVSNEAFKLLSHGIRRDLKATYSLEVKVDELKYRLRKSYRKYIASLLLDDRYVKHVLKQSEDYAINLMHLHQSENIKFTQEYLLLLLSQISSIQLEDRILPKYLYPSAGNSYAIQVYLNLNQDIDKLVAGNYYYNPLMKGLSRVDQIAKELNPSELMSIDLVVHWPAIEPLYHADANRLAYIEAGHILGLLLQQLKELKLSGRIELPEYTIDKDNKLLARLIIGAEGTTFQLLKPKLSYLIKEENNLYQELGSERFFDLKAQSIFVQYDSYSGKLIADGNGLIVLSGEANSCESLIYAGILFQVLGDTLYDKNIGSCMLGYKIYPDTLYTMVIGQIDVAEKSYSESNQVPKLLGTYLNEYLVNILPEYMLPYSYMVLDEIPLTANGKLAIDLLPKLEFSSIDNDYIAPETELEIKLCEIYAQILHLEVKQIGVTSDFFKLGGNSLSALQLTNVIQDQLGIKVGLAEIYKSGNIKNMIELEMFTVSSDNQSIEETI